ncbi:MAG: DNA repair protein RadC [Alphaproteobacteria bacterium]|nr:DNA repair protein RadC [Alphaproteobacteria bacterium]
MKKTATTLPEKNKPWYYGHRQRMSEKITKLGMDSLTESEILEELLMRAIPRRDVKPIVRELLSKFKTLSGVMSANESELIQVNGIKEKTAQFLILIRRVAQEIALGKVEKRPILSDWESLLDYVSTIYTRETVEVLYILYLDSKLKLIKARKEKVGCVNHIEISPKEILKEALNLNAAQVILVHNHPSGEAMPSVDDIRTTEMVAKLLEAAGIHLVEHLIVGNNRKVHSMRAQGILK